MEKIVVPIAKDKECKASVRYKVDTPESPLFGVSVYIPRTVLGKKPEPYLKMTIQNMGREQ